MATFQIAPPEKFDFSQPDEWPKWLRRFERFRVASGVSANEEENQVNMLVYSMGERADDILHTFNLSVENKKKYDPVIEKFNAYFVKKRNTIFERAKFNQRIQESGKSVDSFITDLYSLVEHCSYGILQDEMVRDRIVVGLQNAKLSEKLQLDPALTLEKAVNEARQSEAVKKQQAVVRGSGPSGEDDKQKVDAVLQKRRPMHEKPEPANTNKEGRERNVDGVEKTRVINTHSAQQKTLPVTNVGRKDTSRAYAEALRKLQQ